MLGVSVYIKERMNGWIILNSQKIRELSYRPPLTASIIAFAGISNSSPEKTSIGVGM